MQRISRPVIVAALATLLAPEGLPADPLVVPDTAPSATADAHLQDILRSLRWVRGPATVDVGAVAHVRLAEGFVMLDPAEARRFLELMHNPSKGREYLLAPASLHWFALLEYADTGYVRDGDTVDATAVLTAITKAADAANVERRARGWPEFHVKGWRSPPAYDAHARSLEWATDGESNGVVVTNVLTKILGREGVTSAVLVSSPDGLGEAMPAFKQALTGFEYTAGHRYAEFRAGDRTADYGLAGLFDGGTAAVPSTSAISKALWIFLATGAAVAAVVAFSATRRRGAGGA